MSRYPRDFGRRQFLVGATGLLAIPMLESLVARSARASVQRAVAADVPKRLMCVHISCGTVKDSWVPEQVGPLTLSPILSPLSKVKKSVLVFSNMQNDAAQNSEFLSGEGRHAKGIGTLFTGANLPHSASLKTSTSMDQIYAQSLAGKTPLASLQFGLRGQPEDSDNNYNSAMMKCISYADATTALVDQEDPQAVFDKYFAGASTPAAQAAQTVLKQQRKSVLDGVLDQANALKSKLSSADASKLDQYFTSVRGLETQFAATTSSACLAGTRPADSSSSDFQARANAFMDLAVLAYSCDLTRAITFNFGAGHNDHKYSFLPGVDDNHHSLTHDMGRSGVPAQLVSINTWEISVLARMFEGLMVVQEGAATVLDNSVTLVSSEIGLSGPHDYTDLPVLLVGGAGGAIVGNRHVRGGTSNGYGNMTEVQLAILQALGTGITSFGGFNTTKPMSLTA